MAEKKFILKVGKRGEIYTTAEFRKASGIEVGSKVIAIVSEKGIILKPKKTALSLLREPDLTPPVSPDEITEERRKLAKWLSER